MSRRHQRYGCVAFVLSIVACAIQSAGAEAPSAQWHQWRGPQRNGHSSATGLSKDWEAQPPKLLWSSEGLGQGFASISLDSERIYSMGDIDGKQMVVALNAADGKKVWQTPISDKSKHSHPGSRCTPTIDGDLLYVVGSNGDIACLKKSDGEIVWQKNFKQEWKGRMMSGWGYAESPLVDGDWVLCTPGGKDAMMVALDKKTGDEVWACAVAELGENGRDGAGYSSIVISEAAGVKQYVQLTGRGVIGVQAKDGKFLWGYNKIANRTANIPTPIIDGDHVFCSTGYGTGAALLKLSPGGDTGVTAEEVYFLPANKLQNHHGGMLLIGDHIYCGHAHNNGFPICIELKTGNIVWGGDKRGPGKGSAAITYADGHIVFRYQSGDVALIEATTASYNLKGAFKPEYVRSPSWSHPVIVSGRMYLREQDKLMCYNVKADAS